MRMIPQFFDVLEIKFQTEFKWDTNERGGMLQRMKFFIGSPFGGNDDRRQWRKQGGVVGAAASKTQVLFKHEADAGCRNPIAGERQRD